MRGWIASVFLTNNPDKLVEYFECTSACDTKCYKGEDGIACLKECGPNQFMKDDGNCHDCEEECDQCYGKRQVCVDCSASDLQRDPSDGKCKCTDSFK